MREPEKFFVVWRDNGGSPTVKHPNYETAFEECKRLARTHQGKFHVLAIVSTMEYAPVHLTGPTPVEFHDRQIPF